MLNNLYTAGKGMVKNQHGMVAACFVNKALTGRA
jgi:hypothetical protein